MAKQSNVSWRQRTNLGRDQVRITTLDDPSMINSTSKMRVALGGIGPCPRGPYPMSDEIVSFALCPLDILAMPSSHPAITSFLPRVNWNGLPRSLELSTFFAVLQGEHIVAQYL